MFCEKCGAEIKQGSKFCSKCGSKVEEIGSINDDFTQKLENGIFQNVGSSFDTSTTNLNHTINNTFTNTNSFDNDFFNTGTNSFDYTNQWQTTQTTPKKKKTGLIVFLVLLLVLLLAAGGFAGYWFLLRQKPINPEDFISIKVDRTMEGYASADVDVNFNKLSNLIGYKNLKKALIQGMSEKDLKQLQKDKDFKIDTATETKAGKNALNAENFIVAKIGKTDQLSNGDEITVEFSLADGLDYDSYSDLLKVLKIKLDQEYTYTVSGLEAGKKIDVMLPDLEKYVSFVGTQGKGTAVLNMDKQKYIFENDFQVEMSGDVGKVTKNGNYLGKLIYFIATEEGKPVLGQLSEGDKIVVTAVADDDLVASLINDKLSISYNLKEIIVGQLASVLDPSVLDSTQLKDVAEFVVIAARNTYAEGCPSLDTLYKMKNKNDENDMMIGYLFKTTDKRYYFFYNQLFKTADGKIETSDTRLVDLGSSSGDLQNKLSDYNFESIDAKSINSNKYAVGKYAHITVKGLNIRTGPSVDYERFKLNGKFQAYEENEVLEIIDEARDSDNDLWYKVNVTRNNTEYKLWASAKYIEIVDDPSLVR